VSYVDAGYSIGLGVLFLYAVGLFLRRRALERAVELSPPGPVEGPTETGSASGP
jgi:hypothetical protein